MRLARPYFPAQPKLRPVRTLGVVARLLQLGADVQKGDLPAFTFLHSNATQTQTVVNTCPLLPPYTETEKKRLHILAVSVQ